MSEKDSFKSQRDRFLAFAFASSDLFIEVGADENVSYAIGAIKGMIGIQESELIGREWLSLFDKVDRPLLKNMRYKAKAGIRCGPSLVKLSPEIGEDKKALVTGIKMPGTDVFYLTLGVSNMLMSKIGEVISSEFDGKVMTREEFSEAAEEALKTARELGQDVDVTLLDLKASEADKDRMGEDGWNALATSIGDFLKSRSIDGQTAAEIADGKYSVIHDKNVDGDTIKEQIKQLAIENDPTGEGLEVSTKTVASDLSDMSDRDAARALVYTINEFERKGTDLTIDNLNTGFKAYVAANAQKIKDFQSLVERLDFKMYFQPIVNLQTLEASHFEMLSRFEEGDTMEWIMFGEDIGLASEFDIAVCERAINYIVFKAGGSSSKFSINISGQSIQDESFFEKLEQKLSVHHNISDRIIFEITESSHIHDLDKVSHFITKLQNAGFKVALDDFGAGSASFEYLQKLTVDWVKIDGKYIRKIQESQRDAAMVKNLSQMCKDLGIEVVAEFVEEEAQMEMLREMGIEYGQGYLFSKPIQKPDFVLPASLKNKLAG